MRWMLVAMLAAGCGTKGSAEDPSGGLCTIRPQGDDAPAFVWPRLAGKPPPPVNSWRWINVWATFCKPCVNELPRLVAWSDRFAAAGLAVDFVFVNADVDPSDVDAFRKDFPDTPPAKQSVMLADPEATMPAWFRALGLTGQATIPIQVLVDPAGKVACIRSASVEDGDYARAEAFLRKPS